MAGYSAEAHLLELLNPIAPLPPYDDWTIAPDFAVLLASHILLTRPETVVELGAGLSTLVIGYALKKTGRGKLVSVEHHKAYSQKIETMVQAHGLESHVQIVQSPLAACAEMPGQRWYTLRADQLPANIDLLVVDGSPGMDCKKSRLPAVPLLWKALRSHSVIMLDDARRADEKENIKDWLAQFDELSCTIVPTQKGTAIFQKSAKGA